MKARVTHTEHVDGHTQYVIQVEGVATESYTVCRRYSDFELLYANVKNQLPPKECPKFPRKHLVFNETDKTLTERTNAFNLILEAVLSAKFFQNELFEWAGPFLDPDLVGDDYRQRPKSATGKRAAVWMRAVH